MLKFSSFFIADHCRACPASKPGRATCRHRSLQPAKPAPRSGFFHRVGDSDFALHRGRFSDFAFLPENPSPGQRRRSGSDAVLAASLPECFFHHSHAQPSGNRIASLKILCWATQSCVGHRIARCLPENSGSALLYSRALPENSGSASVHSDALPDSPPGLPGKNCVSGVVHSDVLTYSPPGSLRRIWEVKTKVWERSGFSPRSPHYSCFEARLPACSEQPCLCADVLAS